MKTIFQTIKYAVFIFFLTEIIVFSQDSFFPEIQNWELSEDKEIYDSNNLWDLINGAADLFLEYSFIELHVGSYKTQDNKEVKVEIYHHNNPINAFGIYSQERNPEYNFIEIGTQGYIDDYILNFLSGIYYVKLSTYTKGQLGQDLLLEIAQNIEKSLKQDNSFPKILNIFPEEEKNINSEKYIARNFLGYSFLNSVTTVLYDSVETFTLFIIGLKSSEDADSTLKKFINLQSAENISQFEDNGYKINDKNNGLITLAIENNFIFGILNCSDQNKIQKYMIETKMKLRAF